MTNVEALVATNLWWTERKDRGAHDYIRRSVPLLFQTLDALYIESRKLPLNSISGRRIHDVNSNYTITYGMFLSPTDYASLRSVLSLCGDVYELLEPLNDLKESELLELDAYIRKLYGSALLFKEVRNFFTHLGEAITNMNRHGISGPVVTESGITYTDNATYCVHLIWDNNTIFFTYNKKEFKVEIDRPTLDPIFQNARELFREITSHETLRGQNAYTLPENLYREVPPLNCDLC